MFKKNNYVFTIKFDPRIKEQKEAAKILNEVGRKKAVLIANAINFYYNAPDFSKRSSINEPNPFAQDSNEEKIKQDLDSKSIQKPALEPVQETIQESGSFTGIFDDKTSADNKESEPDPIVTEEITNASPLENTQDPGYSEILAAINNFNNLGDE